MLIRSVLTITNPCVGVAKGQAISLYPFLGVDREPFWAPSANAPQQTVAEHTIRHRILEARILLVTPPLGTKGPSPTNKRPNACSEAISGRPTSIPLFGSSTLVMRAPIPIIRAPPRAPQANVNLVVKHGMQPVRGAQLRSAKFAARAFCYGPVCKSRLGAIAQGRVPDDQAEMTMGIASSSLPAS